MTTPSAATLREIAETQPDPFRIPPLTPPREVAGLLREAADTLEGMFIDGAFYLVGPDDTATLRDLLPFLRDCADVLAPPRPHPRRPWWRHWLWLLVRRRVA